MKITKRTLGIGRKQLCAVKDEKSEITNNIDEVIKVAELGKRHNSINLQKSRHQSLKKLQPNEFTVDSLQIFTEVLTNWTRASLDSNGPKE